MQDAPKVRLASDTRAGRGGNGVERPAPTMCPHRIVRSRSTSPERRSFKPAPLRASSNSLNYRASNIRTKTAVVRLRRRKWAERDGKWPEVGVAVVLCGSDKRPEKPTFCGFPTADQERKKNISTDETGGGKLTRRKHSFRWGTLNHHHAGVRPHDEGVCKQGRRPRGNQHSDERTIAVEQGAQPGECSAGAATDLFRWNEEPFADDWASSGRWLRGRATALTCSSMRRGWRDAGSGSARAYLEWARRMGVQPPKGPECYVGYRRTQRASRRRAW
jgi:hypothetical protein